MEVFDVLLIVGASNRQFLNKMAINFSERSSFYKHI